MYAIDDGWKDSVIKANLATVEAHFHSEALNEVEKACELYTDDIVLGGRRFRLPLW
jgi:hypothetical protein